MPFDLGPRLGDDYLDPLRHVLALRPEGIAVEFGVGSGRTLRLIAETMPVVGFDSFTGLPEDWRPGFPKGCFACPVPEVPGAVIVAGSFTEALSMLTFNALVGLVHLDADLYSSTVTALKALEPVLKSGTIIVFDEFHGYSGSEAHEEKAWAEFLDRTGWEHHPLGHGPEQLAVVL